MSRVAARKALGQHFLHDPAVIDRAVSEIAPRPGDVMVEIGGGEGALTRPLLDRLGRLHVIETDPRLAAVLSDLATSGGLTVHQADALRFPLDRLGSGSRTLRVVGNLPYSISTPLLFHFLRYRDLILDLHLMLQKEVAARICARPDSKQYGRLTVMLAAWMDIERCFDIGPGAFRPPPRVWSTFVRIVPRPTPRFEIDDQAAFERLVALAFSMRRKTVRRILKGRLSASEILEAGFDPTLRPENLRPEDFARLSKLTG